MNWLLSMFYVVACLLVTLAFLVNVNWRYCYLSNVQNLHSLAIKMKYPTDEVSRYIYSASTPETKGLLTAYEPSKEPSAEIKQALLHELNKCLVDNDFYSKGGFEKLKDSLKRSEDWKLLQKLMGEKLDGDELIRRNWLALHVAYPQDIAVGQGGLMIVRSVFFLIVFILFVGLPVSKNWSDVVGGFLGINPLNTIPIRSIDEVVQERKRLFEATVVLSEIEPDRQVTVMNTVESHARGLEELTERQTALAAKVTPFTFPVFISVMLIAFLAFKLWPGEPPAIRNELTIDVYALNFAVAAFIIFAPMYLAAIFNRHLTNAGRLMLLTVWPSTVSTVYAAILIAGPPSWKEIIAFLTYEKRAGMAGALCVAIAMLIYTAFVYTLNRYRCRKHPDAMLVHSLLNMLAAIKQNEEKWPIAEFRSGLVVEMERIATTVEIDLPQVMRSGDPETDAWLRRMTARMATQFRQTKQALITPQDKTRTWLINRLNESIVYVTTGEWDSLQKYISTELVPGRKRLIARFGFVVQTAFLALLPTIVLWLAFGNKTPLPLSAGAAIWAFLSLTSALDPTASTKLAAFKDVFPLFPVSGGK
jgi:hypothetical protein